jgi:hypothetical protein
MKSAWWAGGWYFLRDAKGKKNPSFPRKAEMREAEKRVVSFPRFGDYRGGGGLGAGLAVNGVKNFLPVDGNFFGRHNAQPNLITADFHDRDGDIVVDHDAFVFFPGQY